MQERTSQNSITINAVIDTSAVLLSHDMKEEDTIGLLGFYMRKENLDGTGYDIQSIKYFKDIVPHLVDGTKYNNKDVAEIQVLPK